MKNKFEVSINKEVLEAVLNHIKPLSDETPLHFTKKNLHLRVVDPCHVSLADIILEKDAFESFCSSDIEIGLNIDHLNNFIELLDDNNPISIKYDDQRIHISQDGLHRRFKPIEMPNMYKINLEKAKGKRLVTIKGVQVKELKRFCATANIADFVVLKCLDDQFYGEADSSIDNEDDTIYADFSYGDIEFTTEKQFARSLFSVDFLSNLLNGFRDNALVNIGLGTDNPIMFELNVDGYWHIIRLISPRIESE